MLLVFACLAATTTNTLISFRDESSGGLPPTEATRSALKDPGVEATDPSDIETFLQWTKELARGGGGGGVEAGQQEKKEVLMAYASNDYKVLAYNCLLSLHRVGVRNAGILTLDDETVQFFKERDIPAYNVAKITKGIPEDVQLKNSIVPADLDLSRLRKPHWASRWNSGSTVRWLHWMLRHYLALRVLKEGYGVYQTDVDMVFVNNPYDWLDLEADLEGQDQSWPRAHALNLGIGHVAATNGGILHWETTNNMMRYLGDDPQSIENLKLMDPLIEQVGTIDSKPCHKNFPSVICEWKNTPMVRYRKWAVSMLPMGYKTNWEYPADGNIADQAIIGIHVHATPTDYQQGKTKLYAEWCKKHRLWFLPEADEVMLLGLK